MTNPQTRKEFIDAIKARLDKRQTNLARDLAHRASLFGFADVADRAYAAATRIDKERQEELELAGKTKPLPDRKPLREGGRYSVILGKSDDLGAEAELKWKRVVFTVERQPENAAFAPNELVVRKKTGPGKDDWKMFAFVYDDGQRVKIWNRFSKDKELAEEVKLLQADPDEHARQYALETCECPRCGAVLENDLSRASLIGPTCAERWGWPYIKDAAQAAHVLARRKSNQPQTEAQVAEELAERLTRED